MFKELLFCNCSCSKDIGESFSSNSPPREGATNWGSFSKCTFLVSIRIYSTKRKRSIGNISLFERQNKEIVIEIQSFQDYAKLVQHVEKETQEFMIRHVKISEPIYSGRQCCLTVGQFFKFQSISILIILNGWWQKINSVNQQSSSERNSTVSFCWHWFQSI